MKKSVIRQQQMINETPETRRVASTIASVSSSESLSSISMMGTTTENIDHITAPTLHDEEYQRPRRTPTNFALLVRKVSKQWYECSVEERQIWEQRAVAVAVAKAADKKKEVTTHVKSSTTTNQYRLVASASTSSSCMDNTIRNSTKRTMTEDTITTTIASLPPTEGTTKTTTSMQLRQRRRCSYNTTTTDDSGETIPIVSLQNIIPSSFSSSELSPKNLTSNQNTESLYNIMMTNRRQRCNRPRSSS
jgi:hypothetical protein